MYDKKQQIKELKKLGKDLTWGDKTQIAAAESVTAQTVHNYLSGSVTLPALAAAIIERGNSIVNNKR